MPMGPFSATIVSRVAASVARLTHSSSFSPGRTEGFRGAEKSRAIPLLPLGVLFLRDMAPHRYSAPPARRSSAFGWLWHLVFAVHRPRSWMERRQLRFRAVVFFLLGVFLTLGVEAYLKRLGYCLR